MSAWISITGGLVIWAVHFFSLYILGSVFGSSAAARIGAASASLACVAADAALIGSVAISLLIGIVAGAIMRTRAPKVAS